MKGVKGFWREIGMWISQIDRTRIAWGFFWYLWETGKGLKDQEQAIERKYLEICQP